MKNYKNIVFDVGQVLMGYRWQDMLIKDHGMEEEKAIKLGRTLFDDKLWLEFDRGVMGYWDIVNEFKIKYKDMEDDIQWFFENARLMRQPREDVWKMVGKLKAKGYMIYVLSNYSKELLDLHTKDASFWQYVDGKMVSYMVHELKPEAPIYKALYEKYNIDPKESLFLDDREENVKGGINTGMDGIVIRSKEHLLTLLDELVKMDVLK